MPRALILFIHVTAAMGVFAALGIEGLALLQLRRASTLALRARAKDLLSNP